jgi:hypothetical protein
MWSSCFVLSAALVGCSGGDGSKNDIPGGGGAAAPQLLAGAAGAAATANLPDADGRSVASADIVHDRLLTRLFAVLDASATVAQFNAASAAVGATAIDSSRANSRFLTLAIPRQPSLAALTQLAQTLAAQPGIAFASAGIRFQASVLPDFAVPGDGSQFDHLLAARLPQAWNAQGRIDDCLSRIVPVIVADVFGQATLRPGFFAQFDSANFVADSQVAQLSPLDEQAGHGYDVALALAGRYDTTAPIGALPFADCVEVRQVEIADRSIPDALRRIADAARQVPDSRFVINASINFPDPLCGAMGNLPCTEATLADMPVLQRQLYLAERLAYAQQWAELTLSEAFLNQALIIVSAGNRDPASPGALLVDAYPGFRDSNWSSPFALAAILDSATQQLADTGRWDSAMSPGHPSFAFTIDQATTFTNGLGVDATAASAADLAFSTLTAGSVTISADRTTAAPSVFNFDNARVLAGGEDVLIDAGGDRERGTSFAAPQVAGLAALLWLHSDELHSQPPGDTAQIIRNTATVLAGGTGLPWRLIDAYQAMLNLDTDGLGDPIRSALLDSDGDGDFDEGDLEYFGAEIGPGGSAGPGLPDFRRSDLNGDGFRGGANTDRFDLDTGGNAMLDQPAFGIAVQAIEGQEFRFDERALTDLDVLCYYAYSELYSGSEDFRRQTLGIDRCLGFHVEVNFPDEVTAAGTATLTVHVTQRESNSGQRVDANGAFVSIAILEGATATPGFGTTGIDGEFEAQVVAANDADEIRLIVEVRRAQGDPLLASAVVTARASGVGTPGAVTLGWVAVQAVAATYVGPPGGGSVDECVDHQGPLHDLASFAVSSSCNGSAANQNGSAAATAGATATLTIHQTGTDPYGDPFVSGVSVSTSTDWSSTSSSTGTNPVDGNPFASGVDAWAWSTAEFAFFGAPGTPVTIALNYVPGGPRTECHSMPPPGTTVIDTSGAIAISFGCGSAPDSQVLRGSQSLSGGQSGTFNVTFGAPPAAP